MHETIPVGKHGEGPVGLVRLLLVHRDTPEVVEQEVVEPPLKGKVGPDIL